VKTPLKVEISPSHPLLILMVDRGPLGGEDEGAKMVRLYEELDDDIRPYITLQIKAVRSSDFQRDEILLSYAQKTNLPITLQIQGDNGDRQDTMPIETVRRFIDEYPCIVGL
jgi:hypothetical protein